MKCAIFCLMLMMQTPPDEAVKGLHWNRYTTENFTILSIDDDQGKWLHENLEHIKTWCLNRWGFPDIKFSKECRVFCMPNRAMMRKLFAIAGSKAEIREKNGEIEISVMWLILDNKPARVVPLYLSQVCLEEFEAKYGVDLPFWAKRGMIALNSTIPEIRVQFRALSEQKQLFSGKQVMTMNLEDYWKSTPENRIIFDRCAMALCLMLRKEFGETKYQRCLRILGKSTPEDALKTVFGFSDYDSFSKAYSQYIAKLTSAKDVPDEYLEIKSGK